ncbi:MAG: DUF4097 family beta strand repeat-containing protein [Bacillota bacterium]
MNRKLIKVQILLCALLGVILLFVLLFGVSGAFNGLQLSVWGKLEAVHEQTVSAADIESIALDFSSMDISVTVTDESDIRIVQLASAKLSPREFFTLENLNGELRISQPESRRLFNFFSFGVNQKLELYLPKSYAQSLSVKTRSGNVTLLSELIAQEISFDLSSGKLSGNSVTGVKRVDVRVTSGDISLGAVSCEEYDINASSGNIDIASLKGTGEVLTRSGNITIDALEGIRHDIQASSGDIRVAGFSGAGSVHTTSGVVRVDCTAVLGDLSLGATSGDIRVKLPRDASYELYASCTSGDISGDIDMSYSKNGRAATAKIGAGPYVKLDIQTHSGNIDIQQNED